MVPHRTHKASAARIQNWHKKPWQPRLLRIHKTGFWVFLLHQLNPNLSSKFCSPSSHENNLLQDSIKVPVGSLIVYTDGSEHDGFSGSGAVVRQNDSVIHEIITPTQRCSNNYAELFAVLSVLRWLKNSPILEESRTSATTTGTFTNTEMREIHFFIDSAHTISAIGNSQRSISS